MTELERLEEALKKFFNKNPKPSYESVFKAGIKFGIEMQVSNNLNWHSPNSVDKYYCQNLNGRNANAKSQIHN